MPGKITHISKQSPADQNVQQRRPCATANTGKSAQTCPTMGRTVHHLGSHRRRSIHVKESKDKRGRGKSMERSEPTPVLPIVLQALSETSAAAPISNSCKIRRNKIMLPKASYSKSTQGLESRTPPERRYLRK